MSEETQQEEQQETTETIEDLGLDDADIYGFGAEPPSPDTDSDIADSGTPVSDTTPQSTEVQTNQQDNSSQNLASKEPDKPKTDAEIIAELQGRINELSGQAAQWQQYQNANLQQQQQAAQPQSQAAPQNVQPPAAPQQPQPAIQLPPPGQITDLDFLGELDPVNTVSNKEELNKLLNKVATVAFTAALNAAQDQVMRRIPDIVQSSAQQQIQLNSITDEFYKHNPDLAPYRKAVSMAAMQIFQEKPNLALPDLLKEAAIKTREVLHLKGGAKARTRKAAQPAGGGSIKTSGAAVRTNNSPFPEDDLTEQQKQIAEMLDAF